MGKEIGELVFYISAAIMFLLLFAFSNDITEVRRIAYGIMSVLFFILIELEYIGRKLKKLAEK